MSGYELAIKKTFIESLRSVFLVDDAFPTFTDMFGDEEKLTRFQERERAQKLYSQFRDRHLPCDIENAFAPDDLHMVERLRKCDLIVLDFHLDGEGGDNTKSIQILRKLADSPHFNTVVVYTKADLEEVWLDVAANLRPDLRLAPLLEQRNREAEWWFDLKPESLIEPSVDVIAKYITLGFDAIPRDVRSDMIDRISQQGGKGKGNLSVMAEMMIRSIIDKRRPLATKKEDEDDKLGSRSIRGRFGAGRPHWLQCRGCFIAIVKKTSDEDEASTLLNALNDALLDWKPNFLQILVSEIQNRLELESVAADPRLFSDARRQVGLSHYLLEQLAGEEDAESAVESVIDRIVETLRHGISSDLQVRSFATQVLADIQASLGEKLTTANKAANAAALAHVEANIDESGVISFLNSFLSTEVFAKSRITTGTVFGNGQEFWMVTTPACDLTARTPGAAQGWMKSIHPIRAMLAIRLNKVKLQDALVAATQGRHAFIAYEGETLCLSFLDKTTSAPDPEMFFVFDAGKVATSPEGHPTFQAIRVSQANFAPELSQKSAYGVIGQLRPNYASRVLQLTGSHLSRIGIDFFNVGG